MWFGDVYSEGEIEGEGETNNVEAWSDVGRGRGHVNGERP